MIIPGRIRVTRLTHPTIEFVIWLVDQARTSRGNGLARPALWHLDVRTLCAQVLMIARGRMWVAYLTRPHINYIIVLLTVIRVVTMRTLRGLPSIT